MTTLPPDETSQAATPAIDEPLERLARFAFDWADTLCDPDHGCGPYHRAWSMIRLLTKNSALPAGGAFIADGLQRAASGGRCRVLLAGAADTGLVALVLNAFRAREIEPEIVLADRCATTIEQNRLFARHLGMRFELHRCDISALTCRPVDAVVMHSFLNFLPVPARQAMIDALARALRPGGLLIAHQRLDLGRRKHDPQPIKENRALLESAARARGYPDPLARAIGAAGADFWSNTFAHAPAPEAEFLVLLANAGFNLISLSRPLAAATNSPLFIAGQSRETPQAAILAERMPPR
jgi:SAM-dependent methyltransferase